VRLQSHNCFFTPDATHGYEQRSGGWDDRQGCRACQCGERIESLSHHQAKQGRHGRSPRLFRNGVGILACFGGRGDGLGHVGNDIC